MSKHKTLSIELTESLVQEINFGVSSTMTNMFGVKPEPGVHRVEKEVNVQGDVTGIISVMQTRTEGTFIVSFPKETIFKILSIMYRKPFSEINQSVKLGVGELTNIIYGVVKANLNKTGFSFRMALPSVVIGENHTVANFGGGPVVIVPYSTTAGDFTVLLAIHDDSLAKTA